MATALLDPKTQLAEEAKKTALLGSANPPVPQGPVAYNAKGPSVGSGFGTDTGGRIFRYDGSGNLGSGGAPTANPTASPNVPGATNPDATSGVTRYGNSSLSVNATLTPDEYQAQFGPKQVDENAIREEVRRQNQARIDAVNAAYDAMVREQTRTNEGNLGSVRAIGARSGLLGSDFGEAHLANQRQEGAKAIAAINAEREARVTSILAEVNKLGSDEVAAKKAEAQGNANAYKDYLEKAQSRAQDLIVNLAKTGAQLDPASEQYKSLLKASGMSELEFDAAYNANKKAADKVKYEYKELKDGTVARFGDDGSYKEIKNAAPVENGYELKELSDGTLVQFNKTTNDVKVYGKQGQFAKPADAKDTNFTLGPGEVRYDANGNVVARGPEKQTSENNPTSYKEWDLAGRPGTYAEWITKSTGKPPTADQAKAATFAERTQQADEILKKIEGNFTGAGSILGNVLPNVLQSSERQQFDQAKRNFINAILRRESGAAIGKDEFASAEQQYFAQPGDSQEVLAQKKANRDTAIQGLVREAGGALNQPDPAQDPLGLGFNQESQTSLNGNQMTGDLSAKYESGGDPGAIGYDRTGGLSYGKYQLAHNNAQRFVQQSPYAKEFEGIPFNSQAFQQKWREVAQKDPAGFEQAQHSFIEQTHFEPQVQKLSKLGIDFSQVSPILKDVIWSVAVQHGPGSNIIVDAIKSLTRGATEADLIKRIYDLRWSGGKRFASSDENVKRAVYNRFFGPNGELKTALSRLNSNTA